MVFVDSFPPALSSTFESSRSHPIASFMYKYRHTREKIQIREAQP